MYINIAFFSLYMSILTNCLLFLDSVVYIYTSVYKHCILFIVYVNFVKLFVGWYINTNMYVEPFHQTLNYLYMKGKSNRRVDKCVHLLMKIVKDKAFERQMKLEKGRHLIE